jgi:hypothetical protein
MARPEAPLQFLLSPPEDEPIFRFGSTLRAESAVVWFDGGDLVWLHRMTRKSLSLSHLKKVTAYRAALFGQSVRHIALTPHSLDPTLPVEPGIVFQDRHGPLFEHAEPDFDVFARRFLVLLHRHRPFLAIEGDEAVLLERSGC